LPKKAERLDLEKARAIGKQVLIDPVSAIQLAPTAEHQTPRRPIVLAGDQDDAQVDQVAAFSSLGGISFRLFGSSAFVRSRA